MIGRRVMALAALALSVSAAPATAHGEEDHAAQATPAGVAIAPRLAATTEALELVAAVAADDATIWIDGFPDNVPVTDATVSVTVDGRTGQARAADGVYTVSDAGLLKPGGHELSFLVGRDGGFETLSGSLTVPAAAAGATAAAPVPWWWWSAGLAALLLLAGAWYRRSRRVVAAGLAMLAGAQLVLGVPGGPAPVAAHGDDDHEAAPAASGGAGEAAMRTAGGTLFVPKSVQRIIAVRTMLATPGEAQPTIGLTGRVVADPQRGGLIQSATGGRVGAPGAGLPIIGQRVRAGQVLAFVEPPLQAIDRADIAREMSDLDQQVALAASGAARLRRLAGVVPRRQIEEAGITLRGLERRRAALGRARRARELLVSPVDGVVGAAAVRAGQVVAAGTTLFEIVDRSRGYVEANLFDRRTPAPGAKAVGRTADGTTFDLVFQGAGLVDRGRAAPALFRVVGAPANLRIGEPVTIAAPLGGRVAGVVVPRTALIVGPNGLPAVFVKTGAELFAQRGVTAAPVDAGRVALLAGIRPGERVVTAGADLLGQVR